MARRWVRGRGMAWSRAAHSSARVFCRLVSPPACAREPPRVSSGHGGSCRVRRRGSFASEQTVGGRSTSAVTGAVADTAAVVWSSGPDGACARAGHRPSSEAHIVVGDFMPLLSGLTIRSWPQQYVWSSHRGRGRLGPTRVVAEPPPPFGACVGMPFLCSLYTERKIHKGIPPLCDVCSLHLAFFCSLG